MKVDVRSLADAETTVEHGSATVHFQVPMRSMYDATLGTYLQGAGVFEVEPGVRFEPHMHDTHEFYFIIEGKAIMQIEDGARLVGPTDLVYIAPNLRHTMRVLEQPLRAFCFAVAAQDPALPDYISCELPEVEVSADGRS
jgi:quercetin dioxygenase-like cupin family protein